MGIIQLSNKMTDLDYKTVNNIKALAIDMINEAQSGHPGIALSCAPILYTLYAKHLVFDPKNDKWINRDRFVMSAGHGSSVLYSTLFMSGFNLTIDDLRAFRSINSKAPGHPVLDKTPGVDFSTGPLGQGIASAVGMAIAERFLNKRYSYTKKNSLIDHYTYCLCGDGDLMEGVSYEACSMAGLLGLGKLIVLYDSNNMTLDGPKETSSNEKVLERFRAMNWDVYQVNGNDLNAIDTAISKAKSRKDKPSLIEVKTILGLGSKLENTNLVHGKPLEEDDITLLKEKLEIRDIPFTVVSECYNKMTEEVLERNYKVIDKYNSLYEFKNKKISNFKDEFENLKNNDFKMNIDFSLNKEDTEEQKGIVISKKMLEKIITNENLVLNASADVFTSCNTYIESMGDFTKNSCGRNIHMGVREHAMGAILNGITACGIRCFGSCFLTFSDYLKPAIRSAALMKLPVIYIFTHDTLMNGQDGSSHIPVEQLVSLRSIPNVVVYRPCDANEIIGSYKSAINDLEHVSILIISKEKLNTLENTSINSVSKGAYILKDNTDLDACIISTGSEVETALYVAKRLEELGKKIRVVSMPSIEKFSMQDKKYLYDVLPKNCKRYVIEYSSSYSWYKFITNPSNMFTIDTFGKSGKKDDLLKEYKLDKDSILNKILKTLK